jgi:hypothetical protein
MSNPLSGRDREKLVFQVMMPNTFGSFTSARRQVGHRIADAIGVSHSDVKVRRPLKHQLLICVPIGESVKAIKRGSGIVGQVRIQSNNEYGEIEISYEGAVHGQAMSFDDKLFHAATRLIEQYPTIARMVVPLEEVEIVGYYVISEDYQQKRAVIFDEDFLKQWQAV